MKMLFASFVAMIAALFASVSSSPIDLEPALCDAAGALAYAAAARAPASPTPAPPDPAPPKAAATAAEPAADSPTCPPVTPPQPKPAAIPQRQVSPQPYFFPAPTYYRRGLFRH
jgi:hypothetical protein